MTVHCQCMPRGEWYLSSTCKADNMTSSSQVVKRDVASPARAPVTHEHLSWSRHHHMTGPSTTTSQAHSPHHTHMHPSQYHCTHTPPTPSATTSSAASLLPTGTHTLHWQVDGAPCVITGPLVHMHHMGPVDPAHPPPAPAQPPRAPPAAAAPPPAPPAAAQADLAFLAATC